MKKMLFVSVKKELFPTPNKLILYNVIFYIFDDRAHFSIVHIDLDKQTRQYGHGASSLIWCTVHMW